MENKKSFKNMAEECTRLSPLMQGRDKVDTDTIIKQYPKGVTVVGFDMVPMKDKRSGEMSPVPVLIIEEDPSVFFFGGTVLKNICDRWAAACGGDIDTANASLRQEGGVKMTLEKGKTNDGQDVTLVNIL